MAKDYNNFTVVGRLVEDPEITTTKSGKELAKIRIANSELEGTNWFDAQAWGKLADIFRKYTHKGKQVLLSGRLQTQSWEKDGKKYTKQVLNVDNLQLFSSNNVKDRKPIDDVEEIDKPINLDEIPF